MARLFISLLVLFFLSHTSYAKTTLYSFRNSDLLSPNCSSSSGAIVATNVVTFQSLIKEHQAINLGQLARLLHLMFTATEEHAESDDLKSSLNADQGYWIDQFNGVLAEIYSAECIRQAKDEDDDAEKTVDSAILKLLIDRQFVFINDALLRDARKTKQIFEKYGPLTSSSVDCFINAFFRVDLPETFCVSIDRVQKGNRICSVSTEWASKYITVHRLVEELQPQRKLIAYCLEGYAHSNHRCPNSYEPDGKWNLSPTKKEMEKFERTSRRKIKFDPSAFSSMDDEMLACLNDPAYIENLSKPK